MSRIDVVGSAIAQFNDWLGHSFAAHIGLNLYSSFDLRNNQRPVIVHRSVLGDLVEDLVGHVEKSNTHRDAGKACEPIDAELLACGVRSFHQAVCMKDQAVSQIEAKGGLMH